MESTLVFPPCSRCCAGLLHDTPLPLPELGCRPQTETSLNWIPLLHGLITTSLICAQQTQGLPCRAVPCPSATKRPSPPSYLHSCHPSCANTSTAASPTHCTHTAYCPRLASKFRGRPRLQALGRAGGGQRRPNGTRRPRAARLWERAQGPCGSSRSGKGQIQGSSHWKIIFIETPPAAPSGPGFRLLPPLRSGLS